jgi:hypothetical protein
MMFFKESRLFLDIEDIKSVLYIHIEYMWSEGIQAFRLKTSNPRSINKTTKKRKLKD